MKHHDNISEYEQEMKLASIIFFDFGAFNMAAGLGVVFFHSLHLRGLGFGPRSLLFGLLFLILGFISWNKSPIMLGIAACFLVIDVVSTALLLSQLERAPFAFLARISFLIPIIFALRAIPAARRRNKERAVAAPMLVVGTPSMGQNGAQTLAAHRAGVPLSDNRTSKDSYALLSSMSLSVGMGIAFFLVLLNFIFPLLIEASNRNSLFNIFQDLVGIPLLLLAFPTGCMVGELLWIVAMRPFYSRKESAGYIRYGSQIPGFSTVFEKFLDLSYRNRRDVDGKIRAENQFWSGVHRSQQARGSRLLPLAKIAFAAIALALAAGGVILAANSLLRTKQVGAVVETPVPPNTIVVSNRGRGQYRTIGEAIDNAPPGLDILVRPGLYRESLIIDKPIRIIGDATGEVKVESDNEVSLLIRSDQVLVRGLTLHSQTGFLRRLFSRSTSPAVVIVESKPVLEECDISSDSAEGLVVEQHAEPTIKRSRIHDSRLNGVLFTGQSKGMIEECEVFNNRWAGVRVEEGSNPMVRACRMHHGEMSGVMVASNGAGTFADCDIFANNYPGVVIKEEGHPTLRGCKIFDNQQAGIFLLKDGAGTIEDCDIYGNTYDGIAISEHSNPVIRRSRIHNGKRNGLSVYDYGRGTVEQCLIFENDGTGISVATGGAPVIRKSVIRANDYSALEITDGGDPLVQNCSLYDGKMSGINVYGAGRGVIEGCDIFSNVMVGVAIREAGDPLIRNTRIHDGIRGGILIYQSGLGRLEGCEIFSNTVGVEIKEYSNPRLRNCKINHNRFEGIAVHDGGAGTVEGCDLTGNTGGAWKIDSGSRVLRQENTE